MSKNQIHKDILAFGGKDGGIVSNATRSPEALTGLEANWIVVNAATTFTVLTGWNVLTATAYEGLGVNVPTGIPIAAGTEIGHPFEGYWTAISHDGGQITHYTKIDD